MRTRGLFRALRFDFNFDCHVVRDHRYGLGAFAEDEAELAAFERGCRHSPARACTRSVLELESNVAGNAMHGEVPNDFAGICAGLFYPPALKSDLREARDIEQFAAEMVIAFRYPGIDAANVDRYLDRGLFGMFAVDVDSAAELCKFALRGSQHVTNLESDGRAGRIDLEGLAGLRGSDQRHGRE